MDRKQIYELAEEVSECVAPAEMQGSFSWVFLNSGFWHLLTSPRTLWNLLVN